jgi:RNA polymerase sigma-70 factor (ECF subfamily)
MLAARLNPIATASDCIVKAADLPDVVPDAQLLRSIAGGDDGAFDELYRRHAGGLLNYLLRLIHEPPVAEDLLQEVFVAAWRGAGSFRGQAQVKTWLFHIAHNQAVSWLRRHRPASAFDDLEWSEADQGRDESDEHAMQTWRTDQLHAALDRLSPKHREVIELAFAHELSYAEIAQVANCPVGTVKSRMSYALRYLKDALEQQGM